MLSDPYYFDFISYAQYRTINREISQNPPMVFEEQQPIEDGDGLQLPAPSPTSGAGQDSSTAPQRFVTRVVRRDPSIRNDMLVSEHRKRVGESILARLDQDFGSTPATALPGAINAVGNEPIRPNAGTHIEHGE
jgi:hypothetical protein